MLMSMADAHRLVVARDDENDRLRAENEQLRERLRRVLDGDDIDAENARYRAFVDAYDAWKDAFEAWPNDRHAGLWATVQQVRATIDVERPGDAGKLT